MRTNGFQCSPPISRVNSPNRPSGQVQPVGSISASRTSSASATHGTSIVSHGTSCAGALTARVERELRRHGFHVVRNKPYAGGFITEHYGEPLAGRHAIQVEINRALYMNERTLQPTSGYGHLSRTLGSVFKAVIPHLADDLAPGRRLAAE